MKDRRVLTLVLVLKNDEILLGMKNRGFGSGKWNGFGGKVEVGESLEDGAKRELLEESGLEALSLEEVGFNEFSWVNNKNPIMEVNIFKTKNFVGEPIETDEMSPKWFKLKDIPFEKMWIDDKYWFPLFLSGKKFDGKFLFDESDNILNYSLKER